MTERTYSENEMAQLLERAAELQARAANTRDAERGLTLGELESIAEESGLSPEFLRQAAREMEKLGPSLLGKSVRTTKTQVHVEQWVDGELTMEAIEDIVDMLRKEFGTGLPASMGGKGDGTIEQVGRMVEWKHVSSLGIETSVRMKPRDGRVHLQLSQLVGLGSTKAEGISYGTILAGFLALIAGAVLKSPLIGFLTFFILAAIAIPSITYADRVWRKKKHLQLEALSDKLAGMIAAHQTEPVLEAGEQVATTSRMVLPETEQEAVAETRPRSRTHS